MFVLKKANRSGTTSVAVVDKSSGKFKELKVIGIASSPQEIAELERVIRSIGLGMSVDRVLWIAKTITTIRLKLPNGETYSQTLSTTPQQEDLRPLLDTLKICNIE